MWIFTRACIVYIQFLLNVVINRVGYCLVPEPVILKENKKNRKRKGNGGRYKKKIFNN